MTDHQWCLSTDRNATFPTRNNARAEIKKHEKAMIAEYGRKPKAVRISTMPLPRTPQQQKRINEIIEEMMSGAYAL